MAKSLTKLWFSSLKHLLAVQAKQARTTAKRSHCASGQAQNASQGPWGCRPPRHPARA